MTSPLQTRQRSMALYPPRGRATVRWALVPSKEKFRMNNLHRELAPISDAAWAQIEEETARTFKRYLAGRRVVDVRGPAGADLSAVGARHVAFAEDSAIFEGYTAADIVGIRQGTSNRKMPLPADVRLYPDAIAQDLSQLRLVGVNGPYTVLLGAQAYTALAETS